jgi:hypothetical protein
MRKSWFDESNRMSFQRYYQQMSSWQQALADGQIQPSEVEAQAQRVAEHLRKLEPTLTDEQHEMVTDILGELAVLHALQTSLARGQQRLDGRHYRCPNANLAQLAEAIADRFRRDGFEVTVANEVGSWVIRTRKADGWRLAFGMVYDVTVRLTPTPDGFQAMVDLGEWADKIISGALTLVGAWPWLVTGSIGLFNEYQQMKDVEQLIDSYVLTSGGAPLPGLE